MTLACLLSLLVLARNSAAGAAMTHWGQFRGPHSSGIADGYSTPTTWSLSPVENLRWRAPVPGLAHASPIVWGKRVYVATAVKAGKAELKVGLYGDIESVTEREPHQWRLLAFDKHTGRLVWVVLAHEGVPRQRRHPKSSQCNSTPATDGRRIAAIFGSEGLFCFDLAGHLLWRRDLGPMDAGPYTTPTEQWGFGGSPVIHQGRVIVQCDALSEQNLAAFDLQDGRPLWRSPPAAEAGTLRVHVEMTARHAKHAKGLPEQFAVHLPCSRIGRFNSGRVGFGFA